MHTNKLQKGRFTFFVFLVALGYRGFNSLPRRLVSRLSRGPTKTERLEALLSRHRRA